MQAKRRDLVHEKLNAFVRKENVVEELETAIVKYYGVGREYTHAARALRNQLSKDKLLRRCLNDNYITGSFIIITMKRYPMDWVKKIQPQCILPYPVEDSSLLLAFPTELIVSLFRYLSARDLILASQTCRSWNHFTSSNVYWEPIFKTEYGEDDGETEDWKFLFQKRSKVQPLGTIFDQWKSSESCYCPNCGDSTGEYLHYQRGLECTVVLVCDNCQHHWPMPD